MREAFAEDPVAAEAEAVGSQRGMAMRASPQPANPDTRSENMRQQKLSIGVFPKSRRSGFT